MESERGEDSHDLVPYLNRLAVAYRTGGEPQAAVRVLTRVLALDTKALTPDDERLCADDDNLAAAYVQVRDFKSARTAYEQALEARIRRLGPDDLPVANTYFTWETWNSA